MSESDEVLGRKYTAWVRKTTNTKMGNALVTRDRVLFFDQKFAANAAFGLVGTLVADHLQKRHEEGGPLLEIPLSSIVRLSRQKRMLNKDRIMLTTSDGEYLFNDGWKELSPLLCKLLAEQGRTVTPQGDDAFEIGPAK